MELTKLLQELKHQRTQLDKAINALSGLNTLPSGSGRKISAATRAKMAKSQRERWNQLRKK